MKYCPNCHNQTKDEALFCPVCGTMLDAIAQTDYNYSNPEPVSTPVPLTMPVIPVKTAHDHTDDFDPSDIQENMLPCMAAYLLDVVGIIIALLMTDSSAYARFHIRQALKFTIAEALICLAFILMFWTVIVPVAGATALIILMVVKFCCFVDVCKGKAKDAPILRSIKFLS
jgi:uncharacterized membrane protein